MRRHQRLAGSQESHETFEIVENVCWIDRWWGSFIVPVDPCRGDSELVAGNDVVKYALRYVKGCFFPSLVRVKESIPVPGRRFVGPDILGCDVAVDIETVTENCLLQYVLVNV